MKWGGSLQVNIYCLFENRVYFSNFPLSWYLFTIINIGIASELKVGTNVRTYFRQSLKFKIVNMDKDKQFFNNVKPI